MHNEQDHYGEVLLVVTFVSLQNGIRYYRPQHPRTFLSIRSGPSGTTLPGIEYEVTSVSTVVSMEFVHEGQVGESYFE